MSPTPAHREGDQSIRATLDAMSGAQVLYAGRHGAASGGAGSPPQAAPSHAAPAAAAAAPSVGGPAAAPTGAPEVGAPAPADASVVDAHEVDDMLSQHVFYPAHDKRKETPAYRASHKLLVDTQDRPCLVCGVRKSTLRTPGQNPYGAKALETHHRIVEWALAQAVDLAKFNTRIVGSFRRHDPSNPKYAQDFSRDQMLAWIDADLDNLWVLCDVHHRHKYVGIHAISGPIWGPQDLLLPGFGPQMAHDILANG
jgi:hypothetical protein